MTAAESRTGGRRRGGREARHALRAAPLADDVRPVRPGLEGGWYRPLSEAGVQRIHQAVLQALGEVGLGDAIPSCVEVCCAAGAEFGPDGRLRFPASLVEDMIAVAARDFTLFAQDPGHDIELTAKRVYYGTAGAPTQVLDLATRSYRDATVKDLYDAARLADRLDNIHFFQRPLTPTDIADLEELDINTAYACVAGTAKHSAASFTSGARTAKVLEMLHHVAGGEAAWRARPIVSNSNCHVVPPMKFGEDASQVLEVCVRGGMPVLLLSAGQAGATAPPALAGAVVQAVAEVLAGLIYVNAIQPGAPAIFGTWPFVSDLRTGSMSGGSGEQALLAPACAQMAHFYRLPGAAAAGMADAKLPDVQAGYEKGIANVMAGLSGLNLIYEAAGTQASLLGFCPEALLIDNDMIGQCLRCVRGIEVTEDSVSLEVMREVCLTGPGHYLGHDQTLELMEREYVYPALGDRTSPKEWAAAGQPDILARAGAEKDRILASHHPNHLPAAADDAIRAAFPIRLSRAEVGRT